MHPDMAREIIRQRSGELRAQAKRDGQARAARAAARARRNHAAAQEAVPMPRVPDYVDGTFREAQDRAHAAAR
jgi:hypothetical protein